MSYWTQRAFKRNANGDSVYDDDGFRILCGTSCCLAGAIGIFHDKQFRSRWRSGEIVGMGDEDQRLLFEPEPIEDYYDENKMYVYLNPISTRNTAWAARVIRHYIATGYVDWRGQYIHGEKY
jgi:hypothetical protein